MGYIKPNIDKITILYTDSSSEVIMNNFSKQGMVFIVKPIYIKHIIQTLQAHP